RALKVEGGAWGGREGDVERRFDRRSSGGGMVSGRTDARLASLNWSDVEGLQKTTKLPLIVKGIQSPDDARLAVEHGVPVVNISNHGGRQLDHAPAPIEILAEIVEAAAGRAAVGVGGGFHRGPDVRGAPAPRAERRL